MKNLEIKYRLDDLKVPRELLSEIDEVKKIWQRKQTDIYYQAPAGRLKLRIEKPGTSHLIFYDRKNTSAVKQSLYEIYSARQPDLLDKILRKSLGIKVIVNKNRGLYLFRNVRIHLDSVESLGTFIEFESVVDQNFNESIALQNLQQLLLYFKGITLSPVSVGYSDLLLADK